MPSHVMLPGACPPRDRPRLTSARGFSLVELLIVVAIIGIIAAIGYPGYRKYVTEARRMDAHELVMDIAAKQERFYVDNSSTYAAKTSELGFPNAGGSDNKASSNDDRWRATIVTVGAGFEIRATPVSGNHTDTDCGSIIYDSKGRRGWRKPGSTTTLWNSDKCW